MSRDLFSIFGPAVPVVRRVRYALRGGFLVRPLIISMVTGLAGATFSSLEEEIPAISAWVPKFLFPSNADPAVAQIILSDIASALMTVVSIVFAILLMTLTLASMQFSPRILLSFVKDRTMQWTLGVFLGTFGYCISTLPAARNLPHPFSPVATVMGAMALAIISVAWLLFFIHHISEAIVASHIVDRIAGETEQVINDVMPEKRKFARSITPIPPPRGNPYPVLNLHAGYIRYIDTERLSRLAKAFGVRIDVFRRTGHFVPAGLPLFTAYGRAELDTHQQNELRRAFALGATRTLQQDAEFGVLQIVDIALKAISPAVNDPTTGISSIDQLARVMIVWLNRQAPERAIYNPSQVVRVTIPWIDDDGVLDTAFEQIRHYASSDAAVSLRLLRALDDIAVTVGDSDLRANLFARGKRIVDGCDGNVSPDDHAKLVERLKLLESRLSIPDVSARPQMLDVNPTRSTEVRVLAQET